MCTELNCFNEIQRATIKLELPNLKICIRNAWTLTPRFTNPKNKMVSSSEWLWANCLGTDHNTFNDKNDNNNNHNNNLNTCLFHTYFQSSGHGRRPSSKRTGVELDSCPLGRWPSVISFLNHIMGHVCGQCWIYGLVI